MDQGPDHMETTATGIARPSDGAVGRQRHIRWLVPVGAVMVAAAIWLKLSAPPHARSTITTPQLPLVYWLCCFGFSLVVDVISVAVCWRYAQQATPRILRWSLGIFGLSRLLGCLLWILFPAYLITHVAVLLGCVPALTGTELLLQAASVLLPGIATAHQNLVQRRILWTLWPLWQSLSDAVPDIALPGCGSRLGALVSTVGSLNWRLYRLVIEIRDAGLALRAYATPATIAAAQQFAAARQIPRADLDAAAAACWLETARQTKLASKPPRSTVCDITGPGGNSLREEIEFLLTVARVHAGPLPTEFAATHPAEVA